MFKIGQTHIKAQGFQTVTMSEYVVTLLTKAGLERPKNHEKLRALSNNAKAAGTSLVQEADSRKH